MSKVVAINTVNYGSTGGIMINVLKAAEENGHEVYAAFNNYGHNKTVKAPNPILINFKSKWYSLDSRLQTMTGFLDCFSFVSTKLFLNKLNKIKPDIIHLHNLHGKYINISMLFKWIKKHDVKVVWTLHDCWAFTGQCAYFDMVSCYKWKDGCSGCSQHKMYPVSYADRTKYLYKLKKKCFTGVKNLTIVTPSKWLAELAKQSFLKDNEIRVINNGINLDIFKPTESDLRNRYNLQDKKVILGCAMPFNKRKGFDVFLDLAKTLDESYAIVLVGLSKEQIEILPHNIIGVERTSDAKELAAYYTMADVFANPTKEEVFGLVNVEALACGTPVVTFDSGGSPECIDETCGIVVQKDDIFSMKDAIIKIVETQCFKKEACINRAKNFNMYDKFQEYVDLYSKQTNKVQ